MKKFRKISLIIPITATALMLVLFVSSCESHSSPDSVNVQIDLVELDIMLDTRQLRTPYAYEAALLYTGHALRYWVIALLDDGLLMSSDGSERIFYRYYFERDEFVEIDYFNYFAVDTGRYQWVDSILFFYTTILEDESLINVLFGINPESNELIRFSYDISSYPLINVVPFNGNVLSLKSRSYGEDWISYLEMFDHRTGDVKIVLEATMCSTPLSGKMYFGHATYNDMLYILYSVKLSENDEFLSSIIVYDENFDFYRRIEMDRVSYITDFRVNVFEVFGQYLFIRNWASHTLIAKIEECGNLYPIHQGGWGFEHNELDPAPNTNPLTNMQIFFERWSSNIILLDTDSGAFHELIVDLEEGYSITYVVANGNNVFIHAGYESGLATDDRYFLGTISFRSCL